MDDATLLSDHNLELDHGLHYQDIFSPFQGHTSPTSQALSSTPRDGSTGDPDGAAALPEIHKSSDIKMRACDDCRKRKITCYVLENSSQCFRCKMDDLECTFTDAVPQKSKTSKALSQPKPRSDPSSQAPIEDYSALAGKSLLKRTLSLQHPRSSFLVGNSGVFEPLLLNTIPLDKSNQAGLSPTLNLRRASQDALFIVQSDGGVPQWVQECDEIERIITPHGWALVNSYFRFAHGPNPILHEKVFFEKYSRTYRELTPSLLGAVYLLGSRWWYFSNELGTAARPGHIASQLYETSLASFFRGVGKPSLSLIQAGLLLLQCAPTDPRNMAIVSAVNMIAYRVGLNKDCMAWKLPKWERYLRTRLSWAVAGQAQWQSLMESSPVRFERNVWELVPLMDDYFEADVMQPFPTGPFIHMAKLANLVGKIHGCCLDDQAERPLETLLLDLKPVQMELRAFHHELLTELPLDKDTVPGSPANAVMTIHLAYLAAEISLHRLIIGKLARSTRVDPELVAVCRTAADSRIGAAIDLLESMTPSQVQASCHPSFPYSLCLVGVFTAMMLTTAPDDNSRLRYQGQLTKYATTLRGFGESETISAALQMFLASVSGQPHLFK